MPRVVTDVQLCGAGRLSTAAAQRAALAHPEVTFHLLSRAPRRGPPGAARNLRFGTLDEHLGSRAPLVLCLSAPEETLVRAYRAAHPGALVPRTVVAQANLALLAAHLRPEGLQDRTLVVVTNPVELVCSFLQRWAGNPHTYGFGMRTDLERLDEALTHGVGLNASERVGLAVTGVHFLEPVPVLSAALAARVEAPALAALAENLEEYSSSHSFAPASVAPRFRADVAATVPRDAAARLAAMVRAITASEFNGDQPPFGRAVENLALLLGELVDGKEALVSGSTAPGRGYFTGGAVDFATGRFRRPPLHAAARAQLAGVLTRYHQHHRHYVRGSAA